VLEGSQGLCRDLLRLALHSRTAVLCAVRRARPHARTIHRRATRRRSSSRPTACGPARGVVAADIAEAKRVDAILGGPLRHRRASVVIESADGAEVSFFFGAVDGKHALPLPRPRTTSVSRRRHRPQPGGMGAYSPAPLVDAALERRIRRASSSRLWRRCGLRVGIPVCVSPSDSDRRRPPLLEYRSASGDPDGHRLCVRLDAPPAAGAGGATATAVLRPSSCAGTRAALAVVMARRRLSGDSPPLQARSVACERAACLRRNHLFHPRTAASGGRGCRFPPWGRLPRWPSCSASPVAAIGSLHPPISRRSRVYLILVGGFCRPSHGWRASR